MPTIDSLESAKTYLTQRFGNDPSLYEHLVTIMKKLLQENPSNPKKAFDLLISDEKLDTITLDTAYKVDEQLEELLAYRPKDESNVQDLNKLSYLMELNQIKIDKDELQLLVLSIERLSEQKKLTSCRYWGKFTLLNNEHYYVVESEMENAVVNYDTAVYDKLESGLDAAVKNKLPKAVEMEERVGCNKYTYFVCKSLSNEWNLLPDVIPYHISASRNQKFNLSGDLKTQIKGYPPFFGNESQLLRTLIARISASTVIAPINFYVFDESDEETKQPHIILNSEYQPENASEMSKTENWVHVNNFILPQGRCNWVSTKREQLEHQNEDENENTNASEGTDEKEEVGPSLLSSINQDERTFIFI